MSPIVVYVLLVVLQTLLFHYAAKDNPHHNVLGLISAVFIAAIAICARHL